MPKLSKTQLAILRRMGEGDVLRTKWPRDYQWDREPQEARGVRRATIVALWNRGRIGLTPSVKGQTGWGITPAGRAYLEDNP